MSRVEDSNDYHAVCYALNDARSRPTFWGVDLISLLQRFVDQSKADQRVIDTQHNACVQRGDIIAKLGVDLDEALQRAKNYELKISNLQSNLSHTVDVAAEWKAEAKKWEAVAAQRRDDVAPLQAQVARYRTELDKATRKSALVGLKDYCGRDVLLEASMRGDVAPLQARVAHLRAELEKEQKAYKSALVDLEDATGLIKEWQSVANRRRAALEASMREADGKIARLERSRGVLRKYIARLRSRYEASVQARKADGVRWLAQVEELQATIEKLEAKPSITAHQRPGLGMFSMPFSLAFPPVVPVDPYKAYRVTPPPPPPSTTEVPGSRFPNLSTIGETLRLHQKCADLQKTIAELEKTVALLRRDEYRRKHSRAAAFWQDIIKPEVKPEVGLSKEAEEALRKAVVELLVYGGSLIAVKPEKN